jgi:hypothetical protein
MWISHVIFRIPFSNLFSLSMPYICYENYLYTKSMRLSLIPLLFAIVITSCSPFEPTLVPGKWKLEGVAVGNEFIPSENHIQYRFSAANTYEEWILFDESDGFLNSTGSWAVEGNDFLIYQGFVFPENKWEILELNNLRFRIRRALEGAAPEEMRFTRE